MADGFLSPTTLSRCCDRVNQDLELSIIGRWFTTNFSLTFGEERHVIRVEAGRIVEIVHHPRFDVRTSFGFRAPVETWRKFFSAKPTPLYHDIFAMLMRVPDFTLEGDGLVAMQNARALHRLMSVVREVGASHG